jgi:hypothetical protein
MLKTDRIDYRYILVSRFAGQNDASNGAISRICAWMKAFPELKVVGEGETLPSSDAKKTLVCCDITGQNVAGIVRLWAAWRAFRPIAFMQDSQTRYYSNQLAFRLARFERASLISLINMLRGGVRELVAKTLYRRVGYVSHVDARCVPPKGAVVELLMPLLQVASLDKERARQNKIGLLANFDYAPNADGLLILLSSPNLAKCLRDNGLTLVLLGYHAKEFIARLPEHINLSIDCELSGPFVDVVAVMDYVDFMINPAFYGAGAKNKMIESAQAQKICFAWHKFRGEFGYNDASTIYFDSIDDLVIKITLLCKAQTESSLLPANLAAARVKVQSFYLGSR